MWKLVIALLVAALATLGAMMAVEAPVIQTPVGAAPATPALMYGGVRG